MSFNPIELWGKMTIVAQGVVVLLIIMSIYSLTIAFERFLYYRKARNQSVAYAKMVTGFLKQDKLQDAIDASKKFKNSHVARVLSAGVGKFRRSRAIPSRRHVVFPCGRTIFLDRR